MLLLLQKHAQRLVSLDLSHQLGNVGSKIVTERLMDFSTVRLLDLTACHIDKSHSQLFKKSKIFGSNLTELRLGGNTKLPIQELSEGLAKCQNLSCLDLSEVNLNTRALAALSSVPHGFPHLRQVHFTSVTLTDVEDVQHLESVLSRSTSSLTELHLGCFVGEYLNQGTGDLATCREIFKVISKRTSLKVLETAQLGVPVEMVIPFFEGIQQLSCLEGLVLERMNAVTTQTLPYLAQCLSHLVLLEKLVFRECYSLKGGMSVIKDGLQHCTRLKVLDLFGCDLGPVDGPHLNEGLINCTSLVGLDLSYNFLRSQDIVPILARNTGLVELLLCTFERNDTELASCLDACTALNSLSIDGPMSSVPVPDSMGDIERPWTLDLDDPSIHQGHILDCHSFLSSLQQLKLQGFRLMPEKLEPVFLKAIKGCTELMSLTIMDCRISEEFVCQLAELICNGELPKLSCLCLSQELPMFLETVGQEYYFKEDTGRRLEAMIKQHTTLTSLDLDLAPITSSTRSLLLRAATERTSNFCDVIVDCDTDEYASTASGDSEEEDSVEED
mmetsp:Transcript_31613/g.49529  ORF Transcript_31613/g.49529 Transcript_31613/m.49529 type:complete len:557 (+) Transcript_31613:189-1859(+)